MIYKIGTDHLFVVGEKQRGTHLLISDSISKKWVKWVYGDCSNIIFNYNTIN